MKLQKVIQHIPSLSVERKNFSLHILLRKILNHPNVLLIDFNLVVSYQHLLFLKKIACNIINININAFPRLSSDEFKKCIWNISLFRDVCNLRLVPRLKMKVFIGLSLVILATVSVILGLKNRKFLHGTFASHNWYRYQLDLYLYIF